MVNKGAEIKIVSKKTFLYFAEFLFMKYMLIYVVIQLCFVEYK